MFNQFLIIKPTRCTNFSNLFLDWKSTCCRQFFCPSPGVSHCTHSNGICHMCLLTACERDQDPSWSCSQAVSRSRSCSQAVSRPVWHIPLLCVQWKAPDDGQRNCAKHVKFQSKNKFEKIVHLVGFIIRNLSRCTVTWTSNVQSSVILRQRSRKSTQTPLLCLTLRLLMSYIYIYIYIYIWSTYSWCF